MNEICCGLQVGQEVPDFKIETYEPADKDFGERSLDAIAKAGRFTVLFFYPADFTFVCATEFADLAERYEAMTKAGAEVVTVSCDTKYVHLAWQREEKLLENVKYPMGADPTADLAELFGIYDEGSGLALRGTFIISPDKKLISSEINFYNVGRNAAELLRKLEANKYLADHAAEVCPARWTPGAKTLTPSAAMVGKVAEAL